MGDDDENDRGDDPNYFNDHRSSAERITRDAGALRCILSKMQFDSLLNARLVCKNWNKEAGFFIKKRIDWINFTQDSRLERYLKSEDRYLFPSIELDIGKLSTKVLAKCGLEGVRHLCLTATANFQYWAVEVERDIVKAKILSLLQQQPSNNITYLHLHITFPINFTNVESDLVRNLENLQYLSIYLYLSREDRTHFYSRPSDLASILITSCHSLAYLTTSLQNLSSAFIGDLTNLLNKRKENGHPNLILSILPIINVNLENYEDFTKLANFGTRFETLKVGIKFENHATQQQLNETFKAAATLLGNTADILKELKFSFKYENESTDRFQLKVPFLPKLEKVQLEVSVRGITFVSADLEAEQFFQLPDVFPSLKHLVVDSNKDIVIFHGRNLPNLERITFDVNYKGWNNPNPPPLFPSLRAVDFTDEVNEELLRFVFTNLTSIEELKFKFRRPGGGHEWRRSYFDGWEIFTGGAQPPPNVAPPLNSNSDDDSDGDESDEQDEVAGIGNVLNNEDNVEQPKHLVASLENFTKLRELEIVNASLRDIQAVTYMTQLKKMKQLDKLLFTVQTHKKAINMKNYIQCIEILEKYHRRVVAFL